jgi:Family of unknown function (DUF6527)
MKFEFRAVERIPTILDTGVVYYSEHFEIAQFLCACGCGHRVDLLVPDGHEVLSEAGLATIRPSIGVWSAACKSHYFITAGEVEWLPAFNAGNSASLMRKQIARHAALETKQQSHAIPKWGWARNAIARLRALVRNFW